MGAGELALLIPVFVPLGLFILVGVVAWAFFMYRHRQRAELQQTIRTALEKGQELSPELIDRMLAPKPAAEGGDLRRGLIFIGIAIGFAVFGYAVPDDEATSVLIGIAALPFFLGIAYLLIHRANTGNKQDAA